MKKGKKKVLGRWPRFEDDDITENPASLKALQKAIKELAGKKLKGIDLQVVKTETEMMLVLWQNDL